MLYSIKLNVSTNNANKLTIICVFIYLYIYKNIISYTKDTEQLSCTYIDHSRDFFLQVKNIFNYNNANKLTIIYVVKSETILSLE